jgi:hypothetical protein
MLDPKVMAQLMVDHLGQDLKLLKPLPLVFSHLLANLGQADAASLVFHGGQPEHPILFGIPAIFLLVGCEFLELEVFWVVEEQVCYHCHAVAVFWQVCNQEGVYQAPVVINIAIQTSDWLHFVKRDCLYPVDFDIAALEKSPT